MNTPQPLPKIVTEAEWRSALEHQAIRERDALGALAAVNAQRRRLPMVKMDKSYTFRSASGESLTLRDLFGKSRQLIMYHFMFGPDWDVGCKYCSLVVDAMTHPEHFQERDAALVLVSRAPAHKLDAYKRRMGWTTPWYSSGESEFNTDIGMTVGQDEYAGLSVFLRAGEDVYRTYFTTGDAVNQLGSLWTYLDLTPYGRQEVSEDSPAGWPKLAEGAGDIQRHDEYGRA